MAGSTAFPKKGPINVSETQKGYFPLRNRFKSFKNRGIHGKDTQAKDRDLFYLTQQYTLKEMATLDLIFPTPHFVLQERGRA